MNADILSFYISDHCRIGSLENEEVENLPRTVRSLPHRQLRNCNKPDGYGNW